MRAHLFGLAASLLIAAAASAAAPKLETPPLFEFGESAQHEPVRHEFTVRNSGDAPLEISAGSGLGAVTVEKLPVSVPPGGSVVLTAVYDGSGKPGPVMQHVTLSTNDPNQPQLHLVFKGTLRQFVGAKPGYARWNTVQGEPEATIGQTLWAADGADFKILSVDVPYAHVKHTVRQPKPEERKTDGSPTQWRIDLTLESWPVVGPIAGTVVVHTDHPKQKQVLLPLSGFVRPMIFVDPPRGDFGRIDVTSPAITTYKVRMFGTKPIRVTKAESTIAGSQAEVRELQQGRLYEVKLSFTAATPAGPFAGKLRIHTDSPKQPVYELDLTGDARHGAPAPLAPGTGQATGD